MYENNERRYDKEDTVLFASEWEAFGRPIKEIPSGSRIFAMYFHTMQTGKRGETAYKICHGLMGDGNIRVRCFKQFMPEIYEKRLEIHRVSRPVKKNIGRSGMIAVRLDSRKRPKSRNPKTVGIAYVPVIKEIELPEIKAAEEKDLLEWGTVNASYKGYKFTFRSGGYDDPWEAEMVEPDGNKWLCQYNYGFGAGFEW